MTNNLITEIHAFDDVDVDQRLATLTTTAAARGFAVGGSLYGGAVSTDTNLGIVAGGDVDLDDSVLGDGNVAFHGSTVGAFALAGPATSVTGDNVLMGAGDLYDVDAEGDAMLVHGIGNDLTGDVDVDLTHVDGPTTLAFGDDNVQEAIADDATTVLGSYNTDNSVEDSHNTWFEDSRNVFVDDSDVHQRSVIDSFDSTWSDDDVTTWHTEQSYEDNSWSSDDDTFGSDIDHVHAGTHLWGDDNDVELFV